MLNKISTIIVNDIAAKSGGALTILQQFMKELADNKDAKNFRWIIFVSTDEIDKYRSEHIKIIKIKKMSWFRRIFWETRGIKKWLNEHGVKPKVSVSLMNIGFGKTDFQQVIYLHQPLPFSDFNEFKWFEVKPRLKKKLLFWEIKRTVPSNSIIVVQTNWMKKAINKKLKIPLDQIHVIKPKVDLSFISDKIPREINFSYKLFYPAVPGTSYKNHELLIRTLAEIRKMNSSLFSKLRLVFTCKPGDSRLTTYYRKVASSLNVDDRIDWVGYLNKEQIIKQYRDADLVLFPSKLETFGLPLIEAAAFGKHIFVLDKPYAHDVLQDYRGVIFIPNNAEVWASKITDFYYSKNRKLIKTIRYSKNGWNKFVDLVVSSSKGSTCAN